VKYCFDVDQSKTKDPGLEMKRILKKRRPEVLSGNALYVRIDVASKNKTV
jgi:hypothetical protein